MGEHAHRDGAVDHSSGVTESATYSPSAWDSPCNTDVASDDEGHG